MTLLTRIWTDDYILIASDRQINTQHGNAQRINGEVVLKDKFLLLPKLNLHLCFSGLTSWGSPAVAIIDDAKEVINQKDCKSVKCVVKAIQEKYILSCDDEFFKYESLIFTSRFSESEPISKTLIKLPDSKEFVEKSIKISELQRCIHIQSALKSHYDIEFTEPEKKYSTLSNVDFNINYSDYFEADQSIHITTNHFYELLYMLTYDEYETDDLLELSSEEMKNIVKSFYRHINDIWTHGLVGSEQYIEKQLATIGKECDIVILPKCQNAIGFYNLNYSRK